MAVEHTISKGELTIYTEGENGWHCDAKVGVVYNIVNGVVDGTSLRMATDFEIHLTKQLSAYMDALKESNEKKEVLLASTREMFGHLKDVMKSSYSLIETILKPNKEK